MCDAKKWLVENGFEINATFNSKVQIKFGNEPFTWIIKFNPLSKLCRDDYLEMGELFFDNKLLPKRSYTNYEMFVALHKHLGKPQIDENTYKYSIFNKDIFQYICEFSNFKILNDPDFLNYIFETNTYDIVNYIINNCPIKNLDIALWNICENGKPVICDIESEIFVRLVNHTKCHEKIKSYYYLSNENFDMKDIFDR